MFALALVVVALVLALSGVAKARDRVSGADAFVALRVPTVVPARVGAAILPWVEIGLAVALLVAVGPVLVVAAAGTLALLIGYLALVVRAARFADPVDCACFGRWWAGPVTTRTALRNLVLVVLGALGCVAALTGDSVRGLLGDGPAGWLALLITALTGLLGVLLANGSASPPTRPVPEGDQPLEADYVRVPTPTGVLQYGGPRGPGEADAAGEPHYITLATLTSVRAHLLVLLSPNCAPCARILAALPTWRGALTPAVEVIAVLSYPAVTDPDVPWYLDPVGNVRTALDATGTPAAVLLGADGQLAGGPVIGERPVTNFIADVADELLGAGLIDEQAALRLR